MRGDPAGRARQGPTNVLTLALVLAAPALAGCIADTPPAAPEEVALEPAATEGFVSMPMDVHDCRFIMAVVPLPAAAVAPLLPEGFRAIAPHEIGLPPDPRGDALLGIEAERCDKGRSGAGGYLEDVSTGSFWVPVEPPEELKQFGAEFYIIKLETLVWEEEGARMLQALGYAARTGEAVIAEPPSPVPSEVHDVPYVGEMVGMNAYQASLLLDGGEDYEFRLGSGATKWFVANPFQEFTCVGFHPTADGSYLVGRTDFRATVIHESMGVISVPSGGLPSELIGAGDHPFYALVGYGSYPNMELFVPAGP